MTVIETKIRDLVIIEPTIFGDQRGYFMETFNQEQFDQFVRPTKFIQDNESLSKRGVLRGLHVQLPPFAQAKLVRVIKGEVIDVAVDLRKDSPHFGEHVSVHLSEDNKKQLFIPRGFAHGFAVLSEEAIFSYKVDNRYSPESECSIQWDDPFLNINWQLDPNEILLSKKDKDALPFKSFNSPF